MQVGKNMDKARAGFTEEWQGREKKKKKSDDSLESNDTGSHMLRRLQIYESGP